MNVFPLKIHGHDSHDRSYMPIVELILSLCESIRGQNLNYRWDTSDPTLYGRNYFDRASSPEVEDEDIEERALILSEVIALKKAAVDYAHPEVGVSSSDPSVHGCNYFNRFSASEVEDEDEDIEE